MLGGGVGLFALWNCVVILGVLEWRGELTSMTAARGSITDSTDIDLSQLVVTTVKRVSVFNKVRVPLAQLLKYVQSTCRLILSSRSFRASIWGRRAARPENLGPRALFHGALFHLAGHRFGLPIPPDGESHRHSQ